MAKKNFAIPAAVESAPPCFGAAHPWLAPLAGYSDLPFRLLCREYGAATTVTEMISARGLHYQSRNTSGLLASTTADQPLVIQLFGDDAPIMGHAVAILRAAGHRWFDCNLGCSVRKMLRQSAGASLLASPDKVLEIARAMISAASPPGEPAGGVGFKLRLGIHPSRPALPDLALRLEDVGASWLTLHPRFASQGFEGRAQWEMIATLASRLSIPVLASGDLWEAEDGLRCLAQTGASGVMYARGALRNPAIFKNHKLLLAGIKPRPMTAMELRSLIERHIGLTRQYLGGKNALFRMRSIVPRYARLVPGVNDLRRELCQSQAWEDLPAILDRYLGAPAHSNQSAPTRPAAMT